MLSALKAAGLTAKPEKCVWGAKFLEYLGHEVGLGKGGVPEARKKALKDFKRPVRKRNFPAFLGTLGYYHRFIPSYAKWADPLNKALYKEAPNLIMRYDK